jgi:hypothetical protein
MFNFMMKKLLQSKMKDVPAAEQEKILALMEKNPALLQTIATKVQEKVKQGKSQTDAMMEVAKEHEAELKEALK